MIIKLFICRVKPWCFWTITDNQAKAKAWWAANADSFGQRQVKMVRWSECEDAPGFTNSKVIVCAKCGSDDCPHAHDIHAPCKEGKHG